MPLAWARVQQRTLSDALQEARSEPASFEASGPNEQRYTDNERDDRAEISEEERKPDYYENSARQVAQSDLRTRHWRANYPSKG